MILHPVKLSHSNTVAWALPANLALMERSSETIRQTCRIRFQTTLCLRDRFALS